jgi:hypothetical protein
LSEEGPTQNQIWGILKYLSAEFFAEKSKTDQGSRTRVCNILGQKLGYDRCPYLSFLRPAIWRWNIWFDGPKRLKYRKCTNFDLRCYECNAYEYHGMYVCDAIMNATKMNICRLRDKRIMIVGEERMPITFEVVIMNITRKETVYYFWCSKDEVCYLWTGKNGHGRICQLLLN